MSTTFYLITRTPHSDTVIQNFKISATEITMLKGQNTVLSSVEETRGKGKVVHEVVESATGIEKSNFHLHSFILDKLFLHS